MFESLKTPALLVDRTIVMRNCTRMAKRARELGVRLRPHVKTHKTVEAALLQVADHFGGITVSTLAEAEFFAAVGFRDITYAVPMAPAKLERAERIAQGIDRLNLLVDHRDTVAAIAEHGQAHARIWPLFIKVDCGYGRAGVDPKGDSVISLAGDIVASPWLSFEGILAHAGHSYDCRNAREIAVVAEQERSVMASCAARLAEEGFAPPIVSIGSTPTCVHASSGEGVGEWRPGNYALFDRFQATIGSCTDEDIAASVLCTVIGHYPERGVLLVDAGATAMSKDPGATHVDPECGFGAVSGFPHLRLIGLSQEHGKIGGVRPEDFSALPVGSRLRLLPNHVCLTAAGFDCFHVIEDDQVVGTWVNGRGW